MFIPHHMSHVACHGSGVTCQLSGVICQVSHVFFLYIYFFLQSGGVSRWRVCHQRTPSSLLDFKIYLLSQLVLDLGKCSNCKSPPIPHLQFEQSPRSKIYSESRFLYNYNKTNAMNFWQNYDMGEKVLI